jgi:serine/threonine-protein kinase
LRSVDWAAKVHAVPSDDTISLFFGAAGDWLLQAIVVWILYLALEPAVRARWPHSLVSWNRLLVGKWLDAQVGSHVLIGAVIGSCVYTGVTLIDTLLSPRNTLDAGMNLWAAEGVRHWFGANATQMAGALFIGLVGFFTIFGFRQMLRNDVAAAVAASVLFTVTRPGIFHEAHLWVVLGLWVALYASLIFTLLRFGLVATIAAVFFINSYQYMTIGTERISWATPSGLATLTLLIGIAVFAFWRSLGSRSLIGEEEVE